ncbi:mannonate dehydratase, partial [Staphylococcus aureus]
PPGAPASWTFEDFERHRDKVESFGLVLDMVQLPLPSRPIEQASYPDILLAGPDRDRQIDAVCTMIENIARAGIPAAKYNLNLIGIPRT